MRLAGNGQEARRVLAREIGDGHELTLLPQDAVGKRGDVAHVNASAHHPAAFLDRPQRRRHQGADRSEDDRRIQKLRRSLLGISRPDRAD